jgi:hypothetical protein
MLEALEDRLAPIVYSFSLTDLGAPSSYPAGEMLSFLVSAHINNPKFDDLACAEPLPPPSMLF